MNRNIGSLCVLTSFMSIIVGCAGIESQPQNTAIATFTPISSALLALTNTPYPTSTPPPWPTLSKGETLPSPLYFVSSAQQEVDSNQCPLPHVIRLERDGLTRTLQTSCFISGGINGFDISPVDGSIVIAAYAGLWIDKKDGNGYQKLVEALPNAEGTGETDNIRDPAWSSDGRKIAYADGGIRILEVSTGKRIDVVENKCSEMPLDSSFSNCFYGNWFFSPQWSPDGNSIIYRSQNADYFYLEQYSLDSNEINPIPGTAGVTEDNFAWSQDGDHLFFDYSRMYGSGIVGIPPSFVRMNSNNFDVDVLWDHSNRADPVYSSNANNPWQVMYPFEAPDDRILFFQAEPCTINACYDYALVEGTSTPEGFKTNIIWHNALPSGTRSLAWHKSGEFIAFLISSTSTVSWYIAVMKVNTGEIYIVAKEQGKAFPLPIRWGK